jgi:hypothetical protein
MSPAEIGEEDSGISDRDSEVEGGGSKEGGGEEGISDSESESEEEVARLTAAIAIKTEEISRLTEETSIARLRLEMSLDCYGRLDRLTRYAEISKDAHLWQTGMNASLN